MKYWMHEKNEILDAHEKWNSGCTGGIQGSGLDADGTSSLVYFLVISLDAGSSREKSLSTTQ